MSFPTADAMTVNSDRNVTEAVGNAQGFFDWLYAVTRI